MTSKSSKLFMIRCFKLLANFTEMSDAMKSGILNHYGHMPEPEADYWNLPNGPAWGWWILSILPLDSQLQIQVLSLTSLKRRLEIILRILNCIFRTRKEHQNRTTAERRKPDTYTSPEQQPQQQQPSVNNRNQ